jgi:hypothetical protein
MDTVGILSLKGIKTKRHSGYTGSDAVQTTAAADIGGTGPSTLWSKTLDDNTSYKMKIDVIMRYNSIFFRIPHISTKFYHNCFISCYIMCLYF